MSVKPAIEQINLGHILTIVIFIIGGVLQYSNTQATVTNLVIEASKTELRVEKHMDRIDESLKTVHDKQMEDEVKTDMRLRAIERKLGMSN